MVTLTKELLKSWGVFALIPEDVLPIEVDQLFEASIPTEDKVRILLHEEILGKRGLVYVAARAARRACTRTGWSHPDSLRALDLCDRYASGEEIPKEEFRAASSAADAAWITSDEAAAAASSRAAEVASSAAAAFAISYSASSWAASDAPDVEREAQLEDCRELLGKSVREKAPVLTRYQRILKG